MKFLTGGVHVYSYAALLLAIIGVGILVGTTELISYVWITCGVEQTRH